MTNHLPEWWNDIALQKFCEEIVLALMIYGGLGASSARQRVTACKRCNPEYSTTEMDRVVLFHEPPYYWALEFLYGDTRPDWAADPQLWPPPPMSRRDG
jgi:hypothetical protein